MDHAKEIVGGGAFLLLLILPDFFIFILRLFLGASEVEILC